MPEATRITLGGFSAHTLEIKHSRFIARAAPVESPEEALEYLNAVRELEATHNCWAYKIGQQYRFSDDGEPSGTAGRPILSAIEGQGLDGVVVVVTRYYGGIQLGAGGLVRAYSGVAAECLRQAPRREIVPTVRLKLEVPFELVNTIFHILHKVPRQSEEYTARGLQMVFELEESRLEPLKTQLRDATRGKAILEVL